MKLAACLLCCVAMIGHGHKMKSKTPKPSVFYDVHYGMRLIECPPGWYLDFFGDSNEMVCVRKKPKTWTISNTVWVKVPKP